MFKSENTSEIISRSNFARSTGTRGWCYEDRHSVFFGSDEFSILN